MKPRSPFALVAIVASPTLFISLALLALVVCVICILAILDSGYGGPGFAGVKIPNEASLRRTLGMTASASLMVATASSIWAVRVSSGLVRCVAVVPLLVTLGTWTFVVLGTIY
ncbi:hypothetical protein [Allorhodopirellula solitaria]|uniref:Uncharacterized protein n=1 Tax=Allorhodopirellula solitaria TaxID=2527987 RepID=A0A5C5XXH9_9BACT|nr:hypothetical protein [Allorhodopirellula solitaria]TWT66605.1 hypothetical protein CA85_27020 [Allorhodopirellula solitaria]